MQKAGFLKPFLALIFALWIGLFSVPTVYAQEGQVLGIHILHPSELEEAEELLEKPGQEDDWKYVTIPIGLSDLEKQAEWQAFFKEAKERKIIPLVRLTSKFENGSWQIPNRKEITNLMTFLGKLDWPTDKKHVIVFNEVNHAPEWGGTLDPASYARVLSFTTNWAHSERKNYVVLPAAMDLAAPNGRDTMEAFNYLTKMHEADPEVFAKVDAWNSHSYPNPGFSASPERTAQNSLKGFEYELKFLKEKNGREIPVYITETGWVATPQTRRWLESYYQYAVEHIWSHPQVVAVTPFVLKGDPGPFKDFGFLDRNDKPTAQYMAFKKALENSNL